jgi:8-oxo-dGTP diphosphatase
METLAEIVDAGTLFVVRHAEAGEKASWNGPDLLRPLSPSGRRQAEDLVGCLDGYPVERILSSPAVRCRQTVQPLAHDRRLEIELVEALGVETSVTQVLGLFWDRELRNAVLCTHGEAIGLLFAQLALDGLVATEPLRWPKGSAWLLRRADPVGRRVFARFLIPPDLGRRMGIR